MTKKQAIQLTRDALAAAVTRTWSREDAVLLIFLLRRMAFAPSQIWRACTKAGHQWTYSEITKTIDRLLSERHLARTDQAYQGIYDRPEVKYIINKKKYPAEPRRGQINLFKQ